VINPWVVLGALIALLSAGGIGFIEGHKVGVNTQKAADQVEFDRINRERAQQKAIAETEARTQRDEVIAVLAERDKFKSQLGAQHVENQTLTRRLADAYAAYSLRFQTPVQDGWCGGSSTASGATEGQSASTPRTAVVQLPDALARDLRQLARQADELNDDYKLCRAYVNGTLADKK
jgi:hypothetical protein